MKYVIVLFFLFTGCASYQSKVAPAKAALKQKDCSTAIDSLEKLSTPPGVDQLALLMEYGTALQICRQYEKSNRILSQAEQLAEAVNYTSVSEVAGATLSHEGMITYKGDTFEKLFLNAAKALNYLQEKNSDSALVEVRRMNQKFVKFKNEDRKNYELNSFSKYLSGLIWESTGHHDDACIDYQDAYFTAQQFRDVGQQMLISCWTAERYDEFNSLAKKMGATPDEIKKAKNQKIKSELVFIFLQGWGPQKLPQPDSPIFPYLSNIYNRTQFLNVDIEGIGQFSTASIYNVGDAARASLKADQMSLIARRIGARVAKQVVASQISQRNEALGLAALVLMVGSEKADLRQWSFLPNTIQIVRVPVNPGRYRVRFRGVGYSHENTEAFDDVEIAVDKKQKAIHMIRSVL